MVALRSRRRLVSFKDQVCSWSIEFGRPGRPPGHPWFDIVPASASCDPLYATGVDEDIRLRALLLEQKTRRLANARSLLGLVTACRDERDGISRVITTTEGFIAGLASWTTRLSHRNYPLRRVPDVGTNQANDNST